MSAPDTAVETFGRIPQHVRSRVAIDAATECWSWTGRTFNGYARVRLDGKMVRVHRFVYELIVGPIPEGLVIDHLCRNRACCNPAHLEAVSNGENVLRGEGPPAMNARATHCKRGHELSGDNLGVGKRGKRRCLTCHALRHANWRARSQAASSSPDREVA